MEVFLINCGEIDEFNESQNTKGNQNTSLLQTDEGKKEETSGLFSGMDDYNVDNPKVYYNDQLKFGVEYPSAWEVYIEGDKVSDLPNGDIENGIFIYVDSNKNDSMYIYNDGAKIFVPRGGLTCEVFTTKDGVDGEILYEKSEGNMTIHLVLGAGFNGAFIKMSESSFEKNKEQVFATLRSIKISEDEK